MGNVLAPMVSIFGRAWSFFFPPPDRENPTFPNVRDRYKAEQDRKQAEDAARAAKERAEQAEQEIDEKCEEARAHWEQADRAASQAAGEAERMKVQMEEAINAARRAEELAEEVRKAFQEEGVKVLQEHTNWVTSIAYSPDGRHVVSGSWDKTVSVLVQEERERAQKMYEDAERAKEEAESVQRIADEQRREVEVTKAMAEETARAAAEETQKAIKAKEEAERRLKDGIQPVVTPSPEELAAAKRRIQYEEDRFHFAVAGISGSGKSSLINAFRGLRNRDAGSAAVGVTETTFYRTRYPDALPENPFVWYDIPGAGTLRCPDWQYFNDQGLYVFDCIIVLLDNRFTMTDIAILENARRFNIPTYVVRSKADQQIRNIMMDMGYDSEGDDEDVGRRNRLHKAARKEFIEQTRKSVRVNLEDANLPDQRVYIVSKATILNIVVNKTPKDTIDEVDLFSDLLNEAYSRRINTRSDELLLVRSDSGSRT